MRELPILMASDMAVATLEDRKTNTRRTKGLEAINKNPDDWVYSPQGNCMTDRTTYFFSNKKTGDKEYIKCPYGETGDRLWVRETHCAFNDGDIYYKADDPDIKTHLGTNEPIKWKPSIHMFRKDSRILLDRTSTRLERVQDISEEDAIKEGVLPYTFLERTKEFKTGISTYKESFIGLWDSLNDKRGYEWDKNNWVWVIGYKRNTNETKKKVQAS